MEKQATLWFTNHSARLSTYGPFFYAGARNWHPHQWTFNIDTTVAHAIKLCKYRDTCPQNGGKQRLG